MKEKGYPSSRRDWLKTTAAAAFVTGTDASARPKLSYHQVADAAPWSARYGPAAVVFQDRLWIMGGTGTLHNGSQLNDV